MQTDIIKRIDGRRMANDLWRLVNIPSPTGQEQAVLKAYAAMLSAAGASVSLNSAPASVVGRLKGNRPGPVFQLAGHADHIAVPHASPTRTAATIGGRGAADMKAGLAGILEIIRVLKQGGCDFPGEVLVTVYGMHEAPLGNSSTLRGLIQRGIVGDAALVAENPGPQNKVVVAAAGQSIWTISLRWKGSVCHELNRPAHADDLSVAFMRTLQILRARADALAGSPPAHPLLKPDSLFIGQAHIGDFYNRTPHLATLEGTWRWHPGTDFRAVCREMKLLAATIPRSPHVALNVAWRFVGEAYVIARDAGVVQAYRDARKSVTGENTGWTGIMAVCDAAHLVPLGEVPTVLCGFDGVTAHADHEFVRLSRLLDPCRVALLTTLNFLNRG